MILNKHKVNEEIKVKLALFRDSEKYKKLNRILNNVNERLLVKYPKFSFLVKRVKFIIPLALVVYFTHLVNVNIDIKIQEDIVKLNNTTASTNSYEMLINPQDEKFDKLIYNLRKYREKLETRITPKIIDKRLPKHIKLLEPTKRAYNKYKKAYNLLSNEYRRFSKDINYIKRNIKLFKNRTLAYKQIESNFISDRDKLFLQEYKKGLSYYSVHTLSNYPFIFKVSKFNTTSFLERIEIKMNQQKSEMLVNQANFKMYKELVDTYTNLKAELIKRSSK
jgi:hypothetical protein